MPDLGERANVMGPQPLEPRKPAPAAMLEAANHILRLLAEPREPELIAIATPAAQKEMAEMIAAIPHEAWERIEIVATARVNNHHYVKVRLHGGNGTSFTMQIRLGERDGRLVGMGGVESHRAPRRLDALRSHTYAKNDTGR
ncbi:MAG: hypothetical protein ACREQ4_13680 [Candidatus Binataceae bacterium]